MNKEEYKFDHFKNIDEVMYYFNHWYKEEIKIITLGDIFRNLETEEQAFEFLKYIKNLQQENKQLKDLIDTILTFSFFKEECPLNFAFEDNSKEDEAQNIFYSDEYCENNCNSIYKECWLKYFKELQGIDSDE